MDNSPGTEKASSPAPAHPVKTESDLDSRVGDKDEEAPSTATKTVPKKKKGTAATVKKRPKGSGPGAKKPRGPKKRTVSSAGSDAGAVPDLVADDGEGGEGGDASESDSGPYCICRGPDDHKFMIACDKCEDWFHGECIGMDKYTGENLVQKYICPSCSDPAQGYVTRYKKTCALAGCDIPARIYGDAVAEPGGPSFFCSDEHCQTWWTHLISTLPRGAKTSHGRFGADNALTQEQFMALLNSVDQEDGWRPGEKPFAVPSNFWETVDPKTVLTEEQNTILTTSAAERYRLGEEIILSKKMLQILDWAVARREAAIAAGKGTSKDLCGYDFRLDTVAAAAPFRHFLASPAGVAIFQAERLETPPDAPYTAEEAETPDDQGDVRGMPPGFGCAAEGFDPTTAGMCTRKKCKPHHGWSQMLMKHVRYNMKELARQAQQKLDAEARIRQAAAERFMRKKHENNSVRVLTPKEDREDEDTQMEDAE